MSSVQLFHVSPVDALEFKRELLLAGLIMDQDFEWEYQQAKYDNFSYEAVTPNHVTFRFRDPTLATFYKLKWTNCNV